MTRPPMTDAEFLERQRTYPQRLAAGIAAAKAERAEVRAAAPAVELTVAALIEKLGWTPEYAAHVVQPYCGCWDSHDGWSTCAHADDLSLKPWS